MNQIILGSIALSLVHTLIPSHWIPFITIGKAQGWDLGQILKTTVIAGAAHTISTTIFGLMVSFAGFQLSGHQHFISKRVVPIFLATLGAWFLIRHYRVSTHSHLNGNAVKGRTYQQLLFSFVITMFLSPCFEIGAYFLSAGALGWMAVLTIMLIYNILTISGMLLMVKLSYYGIKRLNIQSLQHNEHLITGLTIICLAAFNFFIEL